jgi:hypothetical protein
MRGPSAERKGLFFSLPATYSSARDTRLGNVAGYYQPSLPGLIYLECESTYKLSGFILCLGAHMTRVIFIDVDDTLIRSVGTKRIPIPAVISRVRQLKQEGATFVFVEFRRRRILQSYGN